MLKPLVIVCSACGMGFRTCPEREIRWGIYLKFLQFDPVEGSLTSDESVLHTLGELMRTGKPWFELNLLHLAV